jgi:transcriptional regulator with XRE-family HTH domain
MEIGKVIKLLIKKRNMKQVEVAKLIGKSPTALSQIISGTFKPQSETLEKLSEVLNVPVAVIHFLSISENDIPKEKLPLYKILAPSIENYLMDIFSVNKEDLTLE